MLCTKKQNSHIQWIRGRQKQGDVIEDYCSGPEENYDILNINSEKQNGKERINLRVIKRVWVLVLRRLREFIIDFGLGIWIGGMPLLDCGKLEYNQIWGGKE